MFRLSLVALLNAAMLVLVAVVPGRSAIAAEKKPVCTVRYVCLTAAPKRGVRPEAGKLPPVFEKMQRGLDVPLEADREKFLARLRKIEPDYEFRLHLSGSADVDEKGTCHVKAGPAKDDPLQFTVEDRLTLTRRMPGKVWVQHKGKAEWNSLGTSGRTGSGWDNTAPDYAPGHGYSLGRTYSQGVLIDPSGLHIVAAVCFVEGR